MNSDGKPLIAIVLCLLFYLGYSKYLEMKYPNYGKANEKEAQIDRQTRDVAVDELGQNHIQSLSPLSDDEDGQEIKMLSPGELTFETSTSIYHFDQNLSAIRSILLKNYPSSIHQPRESLELLESPLKIQGTSSMQLNQMNHNYHGERIDDTLILRRKSGPWLITQQFRFLDHYAVNLSVTFRNQTNRAQELMGGLYLQQNLIFPKETGGFGPAAFVAQQKSLVFGNQGSFEMEYAREYCESDQSGAVFESGSAVFDFIGFDSHYFLSLVRPQTQSNVKMSRQAAMRGDSCPMAVLLSEPYGNVESGSEVRLDFDLYFGPKDLDVLSANSSQLSGALNFGFFSFLGEPLLIALKWLNRFFHNWGLAIIALTVLIKIVFYPLNKASAISMRRMQKLNPEMTKIREKYKDDPPRQQKEILKFMSENKINPMKGCLPILPQMPVFFAYYSVLSQAIEFRHAPFYGWIQDLSIADPYYISPLLLGVGMFVQQKLTPNPSMDKNQERIMMMMPVIFTVMMLTLPAGMVIYMLANTVVSIVQQQWLNKKLDAQMGTK